MFEDFQTLNTLWQMCLHVAMLIASELDYTNFYFLCCNNLFQAFFLTRTNGKCSTLLMNRTKFVVNSYFGADQCFIKMMTRIYVQYVLPEIRNHLLAECNFFPHNCLA